nr:hypothetical protein RKYZRHPG_RKYZRHPG_CDS_0008 [uncultured phage]
MIDTHTRLLSLAQRSHTTYFSPRWLSRTAKLALTFFECKHT